MDDVRNKTVYIVLSQTQTFPSKLIRLYTRKPYAHASLAFDERLEEMYSFARRGIWNPFNAGFIREYIYEGIFGKFTDTKCCVYRVNVNEEQYNKIRGTVKEFIENSGSYSYNYIGVIGVAINYPITRSKRYFCSQFVAYVMEMAGINTTGKIPALVTPDDIAKCKELEPIYVGRLHEYRNYISEYNTQMDDIRTA
jgi:hypothetical protein